MADGTGQNDDTSPNDLAKLKRIAASADRVVGLVVVHGIGDQDEGETAMKVATGLRRAIPTTDDLVVFGEARPPLGFQPLGFHLRATNVVVRLYEVHWADVLRMQERGSFGIEMVETAAWFPWLNRQRGLYADLDPEPGALKVWTSTAGLLLMAGLVHLGYMGMDRMTLLPGPDERRMDDAETLDVGRAVGVVSRTDRMLDKTAGDIFAYVKSAGSVVGADSSLSPAFCTIQGLVSVALSSADEQCDEVQILAHSLGTLIAFHAIAGFGALKSADGRPPLGKLSRLYTIGSPLEKLRFIWPDLVPTGPVPPLDPEGVHFEWINFHNRLDVLSSKLKHIDRTVGVQAKNFPIWGGGALRSHVTYEKNSKFLGEFTKGLSGESSVPPRGVFARAWALISSVGETIAGIGAIPAFLSLGLIALAGWGLAFVLVALWVSDEWGLGLAVWLSTVGLLLVYYIIRGRGKANAAHQPWLERHQHR